MAQAIVNHYNYQQRIQVLRAHGDVLLLRIKSLETNMNIRKQQNQQPFIRDVNMLNEMVKKLLEMLAEIKTCQYFQLTSIPLICYDFYFKEMCKRYFEDLLQQFIEKLRTRRIQCLQNLQHLQHLQHLQSPLDNIIHPVDFQIQTQL